MSCTAVVATDISNKTTMIATQTRAEWRELLKWPQACDDGVSHITKNVEDFVGVDVYAWSIDRKLVSVTCETGAYNQGEILFLETEKNTNKFNQLVFTQFKSIKNAPEELDLRKTGQALYYQYKDSLLWGNLKVDKSNGNIRNDNFYRGGGGCGISSTYSLLSDVPKIVSLHIQENCGENNISPSEWKAQSEKAYSKWPTIKFKK